MEIAFVKAFLERPNDIEVPYFAASNKASKNKEEHRRETRVANETAVTTLAMFSGNSGPSTSNLSFVTLCGCCIETIFVCITQVKKIVTRRKEQKREKGRRIIFISNLGTLNNL